MDRTPRLTPEDARLLPRPAEREGVGRHEAVPRAIREAGGRRGNEARVRQLSVAARERYADVLQRLGR